MGQGITERRPQRWLIIWPERRIVGESQIRTWYSDAVANGETELKGLNDPDEMARELSFIGTITLGKF